MPTSISMVMYRLGIPLMPQELLGHHLGLIIDAKHKRLFWNVRTGKRPKAGYGTQIDTEPHEINAVFRKLKIPITVSTHPITEFRTKADLVAFISDALYEDTDLIVILASDALNGTRKRNGHACVVDRIYPPRNIIRLVDPSAVQPKWREISINTFIRAVKLHPAQNGRLLKLVRK
ncbi:MAG: hypothetical protein FJY98_04215 [Candidatus Liptonbacteria bacterium]|nr:hypothetical protein [Candidatus Liptonbacteria bacterium]